MESKSDNEIAIQNKRIYEEETSGTNMLEEILRDYLYNTYAKMHDWADETLLEVMTEHRIKEIVDSGQAIDERLIKSLEIK